MMKFIFATNNQHKLQEAIFLANQKIQILSLFDIHFFEDIPEVGSTFKENALIKAQTIFEKYNMFVFGDDSGLEIEALENLPGVYSKRYAGEQASDAENRAKVLFHMKEENHRKARFITMIALIFQAKIHYFKGILKGEILSQEIGNNGFGYDSIFKPLGYDISLAQMNLEVKNRISHRSQALLKMMHYLNITRYIQG
ncbi:MAG: RdgB/HAM1 family non-canonical purine NTP pyrophosphatase [Chitinophagaceae bacterium]